MISRKFGFISLLAAVAACGGNAPDAKTARTAESADVARRFVAAMREEATGDPARAKQLYLDTLAQASHADPSWQIIGAEATLDALVWRRIPALAEVSEDAALAYRTKDAALWTAKEGREPISDQLPKQFAAADGPFIKGLIARALEELAEHHGDSVESERWRGATGCAREATVLGPLAWTSITSLNEPSNLDAFDAPLPASFTPPGPFGIKSAPVVVRGRACDVDLSATSAQGGLRDVVFDLDVPEKQTIGVSLRAHGAAVLRVGGRKVIDRPYELGGGEAARFARVEVDRGRVRVVARVAPSDDGESVEIDAFDAHGVTLQAHAPKSGDRANARALSSTAVGYPQGRSTDEKVAIAAAALAGEDGRTAEHVLEADARGITVPPEVLLTYARAVETAKDLSLVHRAERARGAYERVLESWPMSWEAILAHGVLAGVRRGAGEARIESLGDVDLHRSKAGPNAAPVLDVFDAAVSAHDRLFDRSHAAIGRAAARLEGTSLLTDARRTATERAPDNRARFTCTPMAPNDRSSLSCFEALRELGDHKGASQELNRVRAVRGGPDLFLALSLRESLAVGDTAGAQSVYAAMLPGEKTLAGVFATTAATDAKAKLLGVALTARDAPTALAPLFRALGEDPAAPFAGIAEKVTAEDRAHPMLANAATAVLQHIERYDVDPRGILRFVMLDVRRVSGTTDVDQNAQAEAPDLSGRSAMRILRRRIFKKDGRILEPDRTPHASQGHADLSQLEQGDAIEAIYEGWALPGETGDLGIDTPDLLPERTAVASALVELRLPANVRGSLWSHPLLGKVTESMEGDRRVLKWNVKDRSVRRIEDGIPRMDRSVGVSFSTTTWAEVATGLRENLASLDEHEPEIWAWAHDATKGIPLAHQNQLVNAVVLAAGVTVREASGGILSDLGGRSQASQSTTARTILTDREGSRTWLVVRALRALGINAEVVVAENEPFSADPAFPPHFGRFLHPLAIAHLEKTEDPTSPGKMLPGRDVWIDADVPGPPLPAGRFSPELRGRNVLYADGRIQPLPNLGGESEKDEIDLRLVLDAKGDAKGSFTILLRGRASQEIAEALVRVVGTERQRALRGVALAWVPFANIDDVQLSSTEGSWQIALRADLSVPGYAQLEGTPTNRSWVLPGIDPIHVVFPRPGVATLGGTYASQGARENALGISRALQYHAHRRIELPAGASVTRMPGPLNVKSRNLEAQRTLAVTGNVLEDDFILQIPTGTISPAEYGSFVTNAHLTDDAFLSSVRVAPPK
ncbi:MAG: hypothetical protein ABIP39_03565 [Polyangiaceae bacterium]